MDPLTASILTLDEIRAMTRELLDAHRDLLPEAMRGKTLADKPLVYTMA